MVWVKRNAPVIAGLLLALALAACAGKPAPTPAAAPAKAAVDEGPTFDLACLSDEDRQSLTTKTPFPSDEACSCISTDHHMLPIISKLLLNPSDPDAVRMVISDPPYKTDRKALAFNAYYQKQCHDRRLAEIATINPKLSGIYADRYAQYDAVYAELAVTGSTLSYGLANQKLRRIYLESEARRTGKPLPQ